MNFFESIRSAFQSLISNKMRSLLTMLGIIIGISSVILMSSLGKGGQKQITGEMSKTGYGNFEITVDSDSDYYREKYLLDDSDLDLVKSVESVSFASPKIESRIRYVNKDNNYRGELTATTYDYENIEELTYLEGRPFLRSEHESREKLIVIDDITAKSFYPDESAVGKTIELELEKGQGRISFIVVGVFENPAGKVASIMGAPGIPRFGRIPLNTAKQLLDVDTYDTIVVKSNDPENIVTAMEDVKSALEEKNSISSDISDIYEISESVSRGSSFDNILSTLNIFVTSVASISLLVGGIGVMNIMLVSVTERIREIGIRKALGAKNMDILVQFLIESVILTSVGGILGIIIGILGAFAVGNILEVVPIFSSTILLVSVTVSTLIGIIFGVVPARKASLLNPIEALRVD